MKKKILSMFLVGLFLLTSISSISLGETTSQTSFENENSNNENYFGHAIMTIGDIPTAQASLFVFPNTQYPAGQWKAKLEVSFGLPHPNCKVTGVWSAVAMAGDFEFYNIVEEIDYTNENIPQDIDQAYYVNIPKGKYTCAVACNFLYDIYQWDENSQEWIHWDTFTRSDEEINSNVIFPRGRIINSIFLYFLQQHPNMFPILQLLLHRLGL